jgi:predicted permease
MKSFLQRLKTFFRRQQPADLDAELQCHLQLHINDNLKSGMSPEEARRDALLRLGGLSQTKELVLEQTSLPILEAILQDTKFSLRLLRKSPGFTIIAILTLALGIGANTAIFSIMRQVLLQCLPVPHPEQIFFLYDPGPTHGHVSTDEATGDNAFSYPMYQDLRDRNNVFAGLAAVANFRISTSYRGTAERTDAELISGNYFTTLGVQPALGRTILPDDTANGGNPVAVLGFGYWQKRFGADPAILNQTLLINDRLVTIVGVVQRGFDGVQFGRVPDIYLPVTLKPIVTPGWDGLNNHNDYWIPVFARLKSGISPEQATAGIAPIYHALLEQEISLNPGLSQKDRDEFLAKKLVLHDGARGRPNLARQAGPQLLTLLGMAALVLFITCANIAGLLTARGAARRKEISVRLALGGSRWRLIRQMLVESCLLSVTGGLLGVLLAAWMSSALIRFATVNGIADGLSPALDLTALALTAALAVFCGILFGIAPAFTATHLDLSGSLKEQTGASFSAPSQTRFRKILVISQVSLTLLLVTCAFGFVRSLQNLSHVDLGFQPSHLLEFSIAARLSGYNSEQSLALYQRVQDAISALPAVQSVSVSQLKLLDEQDHGANITVEGEPPELAGTRDILYNAVSPGHFSNMQIPLLRGREFTRADAADSPKVVIVNTAFVKEFFPDGNAVGKHMKFGGGRSPLDREIVGVVQSSHDSSIQEQPASFVYTPYTQQANVNFVTCYVRTASDPAVLATTIRQTVAELDPNLPIYDVHSMQEHIDLNLSSDRLVAILALIFGCLAAILAAMGIYGLLAYTVAQRTREIGVRLALGAAPRRVGLMVLADVAILLAIGFAVGIPLAYILGRLVDSMLFNVQVFGLVSLSVSFFAILVVAALATYIPARRAVHVDPVIALRYE